jgi:hypothetical protein
VGLSPEAADALLKQKATKRKGADS